MIREHPRSRITWNPFPSGVQRIAVLALGICAVLIFAARDHQADFLVFYRAAVQLAHGANPYPPLGSPLVYGGSAYVYPIWVAAVFVPFTLFGPLLAAKIWVVASYFMYAVSLKLLGVRSSQALLAVTLATPVLISIQMGTLTPLLALGVALSWRWRNSPLFAAVPAAVAGTSKLYLLGFLVFFAATRRFRALAFGTTFSLALLGAGFVLGPLGLQQYTHLILALARHEAASGWSSSGLAAALVGPQNARLLAPLIALAGSVALVWRRIVSPDDRRAFAGAIGLALFATPILWSSYLPLLLLVLLVFDTPPWLVAVSALASWALVTPDRAGAALDAAGIAALGLVVIAAIRSSRFSTTVISAESTRLVVWARAHRPRLALIMVLLGAEGAWAVAEPHLLPAIVAQDVVVGSIIWLGLGPSPTGEAERISTASAA